MSDPDLDQTAEDLLAAEAAYEPGEWGAIEDYASELVDEARAAGVIPKDYAAKRMMTLVDALSTGEGLSPDVDDLRFDLAVAAALVYARRIGYD